MYFEYFLPINQEDTK